MGRGMDVELVRRAQQGDQGAYEHLVLELYRHLHVIAHGITRDRALAEDAIQQAVLTVWKELPRLREPARFEAWAYRILVNACNREGRRLQRFFRPFQIEVGQHDRAPDASATVLDRDQLERAFRHLSHQHRAVVILRHYADLPVREIAEILDIPAGTVSSRLHHAMHALRAAIESDERASVRTHEPPEVRP